MKESLEKFKKEAEKLEQSEALKKARYVARRERTGFAAGSASAVGRSSFDVAVLRMVVYAWLKRSVKVLPGASLLACRVKWILVA